MRPHLNQTRRILKTFGIIIGFLFILMTISTNTVACPIDLPVGTVSIRGHLLTVELATTPVARACGLSLRQELPDNQGMLFIFSDLRPRSFWMKDTVIPLSIAYLDATGKITSIQDMVPLQTDKQYPSSQPAAFALEVNQGWFRSHGVEVGDIVKMKLPVLLDIR
jgi:uncharacterized membrane protein (UPF0127 family)